MIFIKYVTSELINDTSVLNTASTQIQFHANVLGSMSHNGQIKNTLMCLILSGSDEICHSNVNFSRYFFFIQMTSHHKRNLGFIFQLKAGLKLPLYPLPWYCH